MGAMINTVGNVLFFVTIGAFALWVFYVFFTNLKELRSDDYSPGLDESTLKDSNLKALRSEGN